MLECARQPELRPGLAEWQQSYLQIAQAALPDAKEPEHDAQLLVAALLGLDLAQLSAGGLPRDILATAITAILGRLSG